MFPKPTQKHRDSGIKQVLYDRSKAVKTTRPFWKLRQTDRPTNLPTDEQILRKVIRISCAL